MPNPSLPEDLRRRFKLSTVDEMWYKMLTEGNVQMKRYRHLYGRLPSNPRCVNCHRPFAGIGGALLRIMQRTHKSTKIPRFCAACHSFTTQFPGGAEIELTMLFVDVRGSTTIAERMNAAAADFSVLGDNVNIAARLASKAGQGEVLASEAVCDAARIDTAGLEKRELELKGKRKLVTVRVLHAG